MSSPRQLWQAISQWFRALVRREKVENELDAELRYDLERRIEANVRAGMTQEEARRAALRAFGAVELAKDECRDTRGTMFLEQLWQDIRFSLRMMRKSPAFTAIVVLTLALGIGANTAIFTVVNAVLLRPLEYSHPDQLLRVWGVNATNGNQRAWTSYPNLQDLHSQNTSFSSLAAARDDEWTLTGNGEPQQVQVAQVTEDFFDVLAVHPFIGRAFNHEEFTPGQDRVAILSHKFWLNHFGSDSNALGRTIMLEDKPYTVAGVIPAGLTPIPFPATELWTPLPVDSPDSSRGSRNMSAIGRLRLGVSQSRAQDEMSAISARLARIYPASNAGIGIRLEPLQEAVVGDSRRPLLILMGVAGFVLMIACANVANLMFSRVKQREKEIAVRLALGADRARVVRQLLTESVVLSCFAGVLGVILAIWGLSVLRVAGGIGLPRLQAVGIDFRVLLFALAVSFLPGLLLGIVPAIQGSHFELGAELKEGGHHSGLGPRQTQLRSALVVACVSLSLILLTGAGLLLNSFWRLQNVQPGFQPENVAVLRVRLSEARYPNRARALALYDQVLDRLHAIPRVESAGIVSMLPLTGDRSCNELTLEGQPLVGADCVEGRSISPDYFHVMRIPLLEGRWFSDRDTANSPNVVVINKTLASLFGPPESALRKMVSFRGKLREVVGVIGDVHQIGLAKSALPEAYMPLPQAPQPFAAFVLRVDSRPEESIQTARAQIWAVDPDLLISDARPMEQVLSDSISEPRSGALLLGIFAVLAVFLAVLGLSGVVAYSVTRRTREFCIRMIVGARPHDILRIVLLQGVRMTLLGIGIGLASSFWLTSLLSSMLFEVKPTDAPTFSIVAATLFCVAILACWIPARRATRVDPMTALRHE
jgi:putative ABC transport system permease protein